MYIYMPFSWFYWITIERSSYHNLPTYVPPYSIDDDDDDDDDAPYLPTYLPTYLSNKDLAMAALIIISSSSSFLSDL